MQEKLVPLAHAVETFRLLHQEITGSQIMVYLTVAMSHPESIPMQDIGKRLTMPQSTLSRIISSLSKYDRNHEEGLNLVLAYENPMERRSKLVQLTPSGVVLLRQLSTLF
jgi:DNA-binding MarR family transcriptional regulator